MGEDLGGGLETAAGRLQGPLVLRVALRRLRFSILNRQHLPVTVLHDSST